MGNERKVAGHFGLSPCHFRGINVMKSNLNCYILFAEGCAQESVQQARHFLHDNSVSLNFLQLYVDPTSGSMLRKCDPSATSLLMSDITHSILPDGLLVAGGEACGHQLLVDPRVHHFVSQLLMAGKPVGFLYPVYTPLAEILIETSSHKPFMFQERQYPTEFLAKFMKRMTPPKKRNRPKFLTSLA